MVVIHVHLFYFLIYELCKIHSESWNATLHCIPIIMGTIGLQWKIVFKSAIYVYLLYVGQICFCLYNRFISALILCNSKTNRLSRNAILETNNVRCSLIWVKSNWINISKQDNICLCMYFYFDDENHLTEFFKHTGMPMITIQKEHYYWCKT